MPFITGEIPAAENSSAGELDRIEKNFQNGLRQPVIDGIIETSNGHPKEDFYMAKIAVVFWSGSGNTEAMANAVVEGVKKGGAEAELIRVGDFSADRIADYDGVLMGCPACGTEELDETEFEPFFEEAEGKLSGVKVGLFGSYGWGGGMFMETWTERTQAAGANMVADGVTCENEPDDDALARCRELGAAMAKAVG